MRPRETGYHRDVSSMLQRHLDYADLARFFSAAGNYAAALDMCASGLRLRGADAMLLVRRAQAHDALGNYTQAISDCQNALQLDPPAKVAILAATTLALALESTNNVPAALEAARAAIAFEPADQVAQPVGGRERRSMDVAAGRSACKRCRRRTNHARTPRTGDRLVRGYGGNHHAARSRHHRRHCRRTSRRGARSAGMAPATKTPGLALATNGAHDALVPIDAARSCAGALMVGCHRERCVALAGKDASRRAIES